MPRCALGRALVECVAKGKTRKKYEFGCKVTVVTISKSNWIVGVETRHGNTYDGATLKASINQTGRLTGVKPKEAFVVRGYRDKEHHPRDVKIHMTSQHKARRR